MSSRKSKPYFYIIEHTPSGLLYCGSETKDGCHHSKLLTHDGYKTSSKYVKELIEQTGLESFRIIQHIEFNQKSEAAKYETDFQTQNKCAQQDNWLNKHNGGGFTDWAKSLGVSSAMQLPEIIERAKQSRKKTMFEKYGVTAPLQIQSIKEKSENTCLQKYGVKHTSQTSQMKDASKKTLLKKYGVDNYNKTEEAKMQTSIRMKAVRQLETENPLTCPHCGYTNGNRGNMKKWHFDKCKLFSGLLSSTTLI